MALLYQWNPCDDFLCMAMECSENRFRCPKLHTKLSHKQADHDGILVSEGMTVLLYDIVQQHYDCKFPIVTLCIMKPVMQTTKGISIYSFNDASKDSGSEDYHHILYARQSIFAWEGLITC